MKKSKTSQLPLLLAAAVGVAIVAALLFVLGSKKTDGTEDQTEPPRVHVIHEELRGVYLPTAYNLTFPSKPDLSAEELKGELDSIIAKVKDVGLNTVILQVRPACDALYKSDIFPVSEWLSTDGTLPLDCLDYLVEKAHSEDISVIAWVNPLRVSVDEMTTDGLPDSSPAKGAYRNFVVSYGGKLWLDPAHPEARQLVADGVSEIVKNYAVDGVLFDDYFYPYAVYETDADGNEVAAVFDDAESFAKYGEEGVLLEDFRRANINSLVKGVYDAVKSTDPECRFGVACFGIWQNDDGENGGSMTSGFESYDELYCDALAWIDGGYVDFLAPQIYWETSFLRASFKVLSAWWNERVRDKNVTLYFSHAAYRYEDGDFEPGELTKQLVYASTLDSYRGSAFFSYAALRDDLAGICEELRSYYKQK